MVDKNIKVSYDIKGSQKHLYFDIISNRNRNISKYSDPSPHDIQVENLNVFQEEQVSNDRTLELAAGREIWYPVVDIQLNYGMSGVAELSGEGRYQINQSSEKMVRGEERAVFEVSELEYWENNLIADDGIRLKSFLIRKEYMDIAGKVEEEIIFLSAEWEGKIVFWTDDSGEKQILHEEEISIKHRVIVPEIPEQSGRERYRNALKGSLDYILRSQVKKTDSLYYQGLNLFYDYDARTYRQPSWVWTWGPAISTLLDAAKVPEMEAEYSKEYLYEAAKQIGEASLRFQFTEDASHPAYGLVVCRTDYDVRIKNVCMKFLSPPDSLFLAGWGWMALYRHTGDQKYLEATRLLVEQTERLLHTNEDIIEQDYMIPANEWKDWILDEAGFGMKGIAELYAVLPDERYKACGRLYITQILNCLEREDGLWNRMWTRSTGTVSEISYHTRAMGWAMEGLLSSYQMFKENVYLEKAVKMADAMLKVQNEDGSWYFKFDKGSENQGIAEKGTAYWSGLLYRLYDDTGNPAYLAGAEKALEWCLEHQYWGEDSDGVGGIIGRNPSSGVIYRRFFDLSCTYTSAFFGDALIRAWER